MQTKNGIKKIKSNKSKCFFVKIKAYLGLILSSLMFLFEYHFEGFIKLSRASQLNVYKEFSTRQLNEIFQQIFPSFKFI